VSAAAGALSAARVVPSLNLSHLSRLTDGIGIVEHAHGEMPAPELGRCTDDAGRLLAVASLLRGDAELYRLSAVALGFLARARHSDQVFRLRLGEDGRWTDDPPSDDAIGRALHGLGVAVAVSPWPDVRHGSLQLFESACRWRSSFPRAMAHATIGAAAVLNALPGHELARGLLDAGSEALPTEAQGSWGWPEERLSYGNALIPEALLAAAVARADRRGALEALSLLEWLAEAESAGGHFSFTPTGGRRPGEAGPSFDQQPIEAWTMADACARAFRVTGAPIWASRVGLAAAWFEGANDGGTPLYDPATGAGCDGLTAEGRNENRGAESTLAAVASLARAAQVEASRFSGVPA